MAKLIIVCALLLAAASAVAGPRWEHTDLPHDTWRLADGKITGIVHDAAPYDEAARICVLGPKDTATAPAACPPADGRIWHFVVPTGRHDMLRSARTALEQGRLVVVHTARETEDNPAGDPRCVVSRLVVHRKP
ncbi:MAG: hypothetical protein F4Y57_13760 [Acidobacteria bacterium]|nr:hypothetical protein [Acidobacteriota bacterium]